MDGIVGRFPRLLWFQRQCPLCSSICFRQAEPEYLDRLLATFMLRPVRCDNCWRRYYWVGKIGSPPG